ncbi:MAG: hypothetical protein HKO56_08595 [Bacteroidia bacterium]|nr:hypothetical protein [Bacteroidia bacterium]NNC84434.1 hypothetical protein [Bacteroidia bacterium]NNM16703.1 hypothetical protein [Bacteroidia bacterium]
MNTLSFYYPAAEVFKASVYTLRNRGYKIIDLDSENGIIQARSRFNLFKGSLDLKIQIDQVSSFQTNLSLESNVDHSWFFNPESIKAKIEDHFTNTLYQKISSGHGIA